MRLTAPEEPGNPDSIGTGVITIGFKKIAYFFSDFVSDDIFGYFIGNILAIVGFDDRFDRSKNILFKKFFYFHMDTLSKGCLLYTSDAADDLLCVDLGGR